MPGYLVSKEKHFGKKNTAAFQSPALLGLEPMNK